MSRWLEPALKPLFSRAVRTVAWNAVIPDRERRDGGPELVIRGEHPVIPVPVLPRRRDQIREPVEVTCPP